MRIALIGNLAPPHSTENDVLKSLLILGHHVTTFQEHDAVAYGRSQAEPRDRFDLCAWLHTHGPGWDTNPWRTAFDCPYVGFTLDLFRGLMRHDPEYVKTHPWFTCDYFYQPDEPDWLISQGVKGARFSPPGILETSCYAAAPDPLHPAYGKVIFVGSRTYHPEWPWRQEIFTLLEKEYGDRFIHFDHSSGLRGHALNVAYASAAVVVGDSCFASPDSRYTSDRFFESAGRGAVLVYPRVLGLDDLHPGKDMLWLYEPGNAEHFLEQVDDAYCETTGRVRDIDPYVFDRWRYEQSYTARLRKILEEVAP